ncbi:MAG: HAMP domain-containing histidine kinase [Myxococcales bacterium]|nr:HAMP domain-containing histidine kinase [Myxococcales bacterium]
MESFHHKLNHGLFSIDASSLKYDEASLFLKYPFQEDFALKNENGSMINYFSRLAEKFPDDFFDLRLITRQWFFSIFFISVIIFSSTAVPGLRKFMALEWRLPALFFLTAPFIELTGLYLFEKGCFKKTHAYIASLLSSILMEIFFGLMIAKSSWKAGIVFSVLFITVSSFYGFSFRSSLKNSFIQLGILLSMGIALYINHSQEHIAIFTILAIASAATSLSLGIYAAYHDKNTAEAERLKNVIQSQLLANESARAEQFRNVIKELATWNHDMRSHLSCIQGFLFIISPPPSFPIIPCSDEQREELFKKIKESLNNLTLGLDATRKIARSLRWDDQKIECCPLKPTLDEAIGSFRQRFSGIEILDHYDEGLPEQLKLRGGKTSLQRIINNLITNACEGNGDQHASKITIETKILDDSNVQISVSDNGPGFTEEQLSKSVETFQTTKVTGTGLGLYSVERLVSANYGKFDRANNENGGAIVSLILPLTDPSMEESLFVSSRDALEIFAANAVVEQTLTPEIQDERRDDLSRDVADSASSQSA